jgi:glutamate carboxypeptidase
MTHVDAQAVLEHMRDRRPAMTDLLADLARAESPSDVPAAQRRVFDLLADALRPAGYEATHLPGNTSGGQLYARPADRPQGQPVQLLLGHGDTVWPQGTLDTMPVEVTDDGRMRGPGVYDMKGGLVQMVFALRALRDLDVTPSVTPVVFVNSDEEIGSHDARPRIHRLAKVVERTFVLEPSLGPQGKLKTARKGIGRFTVRITGKSAHAGLDPEAGASAIVELSHVIQKLNALNDAERGITVNVGMIEGGQRPNVVAPTSRATVDVRVRTGADAKVIEETIHSLEVSTPGVTLDIEGGIRRPPLERTPRNRALWRCAQAAADRLSIELDEGMAGGASDGNETSAFSATLDGLGAVGDGAHAAHEYVDLAKMVERTALLVLLLLADPLAPDGDGAAAKAAAHAPHRELSN